LKIAGGVSRKSQARNDDKRVVLGLSHIARRIVAHQNFFSPQRCNTNKKNTTFASVFLIQKKARRIP
jgi:hypothetical protein